MIPENITASNPEKGRVVSFSIVTRINETAIKVSVRSSAFKRTRSNSLANKFPTNKPTAIPNRIRTGIHPKVTHEILTPCMIPSNAEKITITKTSSMDAPANINCGIPF